MHITRHFDARMNQRGIPQNLITMVLQEGQDCGDRVVLRKKDCLRMIEDLKQQQKTLEHIAKKGGLTVVANGETLITTYCGAKRYPTSK